MGKGDVMAADLGGPPFRFHGVMRSSLQARERDRRKQLHSTLIIMLYMAYMYLNM